ncbi:carboxypeptidase-like regulatory domain-containing protein [Winogradskyella rapida]|uniref:Carboxypeptidase-like regulatory domain-containing protein n=1 Tax=Winogradskyella rapida TaxID=549701 RepID=A0ABW3KTQ2_9FLAO
MEKSYRIKSYGVTLITLCFGLFFLNAQSDFKTYQGTVIDGVTEEAIELASLNVLETNISTISNSEGAFTLKVPEAHLNSKLKIAYLGYNSYVIPLSELKNDKAVIKLYKAVTALSPVSISAFKDAERLVRKIFEDKHHNVGTPSVFMTAFYRETIKRRNRNVSLTEAVVNILKEPNTSQQRDAIQLSKARKSTDYKRLDTVSVKLQGGPFSTIYMDIMKYPEYIFTDKSISGYQFSFDAPSVINNRSVYVVNFVPKSEKQPIKYLGKLYVDVESLALVSAHYTLDLSDQKQARNLLVKKKPRDVIVYPLEANYRVDYQQKGDQWYYSYSNLNLTFKVNKKRQLFNKVYTLASEMAVTDWEVNSEIKRIKNKDRLKPTVIITDAISGFSDPNFWGKYNLIEPNKSIESAIDKIRKNIKKQKKRENKNTANG